MADTIKEKVAVVGMAAKFPQGADSVSSFWNMLCEGRSARTVIPQDRFDVNIYYSPDTERLDTINTKFGHFLAEDLSRFDAPFFGILRAEAAAMDPQQRGLLESTYHALESAGIPIESVAGTATSTFVAAGSKDYGQITMKNTDPQSKYRATGGGSAFFANRISHFFDLQGLSVFLDTACSGSLHAIHLACQSIRTGESSMSIVGACNVILTPETLMIPLSNAGFLSPDGICYSFDHRANGYSRGEGFATIILKPLARAIREGDAVRAVIRGTGVNAGGRTPSVSQPSAKAQLNLIHQTYASAGCDLDSTQFFESHGTGTVVGDPIEAQVISEAFENRPQQSMIVGAVKTNIGHLEAASGLASIIKCVMMLESGLIPPNIWFEKLNPEISAFNIKIPTRLQEWPTTGLRRASVNNFGYGGANGHIILDDASHFLSDHRPDTQLTNAKRDIEGSQNCLPESPSLRGVDKSILAGEGYHICPKLLLLSAMDEEGPRRQAQALESHLQELGESANNGYFERLLYTLNNRRSLLPWKSYTLAHSLEDLLSGFQKNISQPVRSSSNEVDVMFVFTGQGAQWLGMGKDLLCYTCFRRSLEAADRHLKCLGSTWSLLGGFIPNYISRVLKYLAEVYQQDNETQIHAPEYAQPLTTALQVALVDLLHAWNVNPCCVIGHSSGEIAAAYSGARISREYAWSLAYLRGQACALNVDDHSQMQYQGMLAVMLSALECQHYIDNHGFIEEVFIGCVNSERSTTLTGFKTSLQSLSQIFHSDGVPTRSLSVTRAYHSPFMCRAGELYREYLLSSNTRESTDSNALPKPMYSTSSGLQDQDLKGQEFWVKNLTSVVNFSSAMYAALKDRGQSTARCLIIEVGPHAALERAVTDHLKTSVGLGTVEYLHTLKRHSSGTEALVGLAGKLLARGHDIALDIVNDVGDGRVEQTLLVDLPGYPFDHSRQYWLESKESQTLRFQGTKRHDVLGNRANPCNTMFPSWDLVVKAIDEPWILDHRFDNIPVYPAAGSLVMAIEATRQLVKDDKKIAGYRLKDVFYPRRISFDDTDTMAEISIVLKLQPGAVDVSQPWYEFRIFHSSENQSNEVCSGFIQAESRAKDLSSSDSPSHGPKPWWTQWTEKHNSIVARCDQHVNHDQFYENIRDMGFQYGSYFRRLRLVRFNMHGEGFATIKPRASALSAGHEYIIHPVILDCFIHSALIGSSEGGWKPIPAMVAWKTANMWVSAELLEFPNERTLEVASTNTFAGYREHDWDIIALDSESRAPVVVAQAQRAVALNSFSETTLRYELDRKRLANTMRWRPDPNIASYDEIQNYIEKTTNFPGHLTKGFIDKCENLVAQRVVALLNESQAIVQPGLQSPYSRYVKKMELVGQACRARTASSTMGQSGEEISGNEPDENPILEAVRRVGDNLESILSGETNPLEILFHDDLAESVYRTKFGDSARKISAYIEMLTHKNPHLSVLEVGAGTGSATGTILDTITFSLDKDSATLPCSKYTFTDVSSTFFEKAQNRHSKYGAKIEFKKLDISTNPQRQGFDRNAYDIVVAAAVLHATPDLNAALLNVRSLIKPGGKLVLLELCGEETLAMDFIFGVLPGWWYGEESFRSNGPLVNDQRWDSLLRQAGFSGNDIVLRDFEDASYHKTSVIISSAGEEATPERNVSHMSIIVDRAEAIQVSLALDLQQSLEQGGIRSRIVSLVESNTEMMDHENVTCLLDMTSDLLKEMDDNVFAELKKLLMRARRVVWASLGADVQCRDPNLAKVEGMARSISSERGDMSFTVVSFADENSVKAAGSKLAKITQYMSSSQHTEIETDFKEEQGLLGVIRTVPEIQISASVMESCLKTIYQSHQVSKSSRHPCENAYLEIGAPGSLDALHFLSGPESIRLADEEIEVEVFAAGLNFKDLFIALGQIPANFIGCEAAGIVTRKGAAARFELQDRVVCFSPRAICTVLYCKSSDAYKLPDHIPFEVAASLPVAFGTAYHALFRVARLKRHETVLIHAGAGGVGQAAIQLAQLIGAQIFSTVGSTKKRLFLSKYYDILDENLFSSRNASSVNGIKTITHQRGIDVVLNCLSGELFQASCEVLAPLGRFMEIGKRDINANNPFGLGIFAEGCTFSAIDLLVLREKAPQEFAQTIQEGLDLVFQNYDAVHERRPLHQYKANSAEQAFRAHRRGLDPGKHVITFEPDDPVRRLAEHTWSFDSGALYVIAGGFGGIGRSIIYWMYSRGARKFLILSRSGTGNNEDRLRLVEYLETNGSQVRTPQCDIADAPRLARILLQSIEELGQVKGCVQASMAPRDMFFTEMSRSDFQHTFNAKIEGSWNLHTLLPDCLDFYILLSSLAGVVGNHGVSNYAAANTYQDALARHRVSQGMKCVSLNLGLLVGVGHAAENYDIAAGYKRAGYPSIRIEQLLGVLEELCDPARPLPSSPECSQLLIGLPSHQSLESQGLEPLWFLARPMFRNLRLESYADAQGTDRDHNIAEVNHAMLIKNAVSIDSAALVLVDELKKKLSKAVGIPQENIDTSIPLYAIGVDSLIAVEVRYWFMKSMGAEVTIQEVLSNRPLMVLCREVVGKMRGTTTEIV